MGRFVVFLLLASSLDAQTTKARTECKQDYTGKVVCETVTKAKAPGYGAAFDSLQASRDRRRARDAERMAAIAGQSREDARFRLYAQRAAAILNDKADSLQLDSLGRVAFLADGKPVVLDLYQVNPLASNADIHDALYPVVRKYRKL